MPNNKICACNLTVGRDSSSLKHTTDSLSYSLAGGGADTPSYMKCFLFRKQLSKLQLLFYRFGCKINMGLTCVLGKP